MDTLRGLLTRTRSNSVNNVLISPKTSNPKNKQNRRSVNIDTSKKDEIITHRRSSETTIFDNTLSTGIKPLQRSSESNKLINPEIQPSKQSYDNKNKMIVLKNETLSDKIYNYFTLFLSILIYHNLDYHKVKSFKITCTYDLQEKLLLGTLIELKNKIKEHIKYEYLDIQCKCELAIYLQKTNNIYTLTLFDLCYK